MWQISILKAKPEKMPYSLPLLLGMFCINFSILFYIVALASGSLAIGLWKTLLALSLITLFTALSLQLRRLPERFVQALSSLLAAQSVILVTCVTPYILILSFLSAINSNVIYIIGLSICSALLIAASVWLFTIYSVIYRSALELSINASYFLTVLFVALVLLIFKWIH
jgi:hypothetical protein